jgi:hypothetical protein
MAITLDSISQKVASSAVRNLVLGVEKVGKSTFCAGKPGTVFLPIKGEEGIDAVAPMAFPTMMSFEDVMDAIAALYQGEHSYTHLAIDSASSLEPLIWDACCRHHNAQSIERVLGGFGKGYVEALKWWRELTDGLDALRNDRGMTVSLIGHCKVKTFNDPLNDPYDHWIFDIQDRAANYLMRWADCVLFAAYKNFTTKKELKGDAKTTHGVGSGERTLFTQKRPAHPGGCRWAIPHELKLDFPTYEAELVKAQQRIAARASVMPKIEAAEPVGEPR